MTQHWVTAQGEPTSPPRASSIRASLLTLVAASSLLLAACAAGSPSATSTGPEPSVIELTITEQRIGRFLRDGQEVTSIRVTAGQEYVFRVTAGKYDHSFFIGRAEDLAARQYERLVGAPLWSNGVREVSHTFATGDTVQFACPLSGHYGLMHGDFIVEP